MEKRSIRRNAIKSMFRRKGINGLYAQFIIAIIMFLIIVTAAFPLIVTINNSLKNNYEIASGLLTLPQAPRFENWMFGLRGMGVNMINSLIVCLVSTAGIVLSGSVVAYVMTRHEFPGKEVIFAGIIALMVVPAVLTLVPSYLLMLNLGFLNTWWALIFQYISVGQVGAIFLFRTFFSQQPNELFEAARIDGAGDFAMFFRICLPLAVAILAIQGVNSFAGIYNDFLWPTLVINSRSIQTLMPILRTVSVPAQGAYLSRGIMYATFLLSGLPLVFTTALGLKFFVKGDFAAGMKI